MPAVQTVRCPRCGRENRAGAKFCAGCGAPLAQQPTPPPAPVSTEEAKEAAHKIWDLVKTVVTVGGRTAWLELTNPQPALEGTVVERVKIDAMTPPNEPAFWALLGVGFVLVVFALAGFWLFPFLATVITLVLSWRKWRRPYFSLIGWKSLLALIGKPAQAPAWHLKVRTAKGETEVTIVGETKGNVPKEGERVWVWGIFDDKNETRLRAWKVQPLNAFGQPEGQPLTAPPLFPLVPSLFFLSLLLFLLSLLVNLSR